MGIRIVTPGGSVCYEIPVMKLQQYTIEEIFEKELLFLIPFYIFLHESRFKEYNESTVRLESLLQEYEAKTIRDEGIKEGLQKGRLEMLFDLVRNNLLTIKDAASQAKLTEESFKEKMMDSGR